MIFFDLDDTLINTHRRHYEIILSFLTINNFQPSFFTFSEYLKIRKDSNKTNKEVLSLKISNSTILEEFSTYFLENIEHPNFLKFDEKIIDVENLLILKEKGKKLGICSLRSQKLNALNQLDNLDIAKYFDEIVFLKHNINNPKSTFFKEKDRVEMFIGDSQSDYEAVNENDIKFIGVATGFYKINPPLIFSDINIAINSFV